MEFFDGSEFVVESGTLYVPDSQKDKIGPGTPQADTLDNPDFNNQCRGSFIQVEGQILGESIPVTGTSLSLNYNSDRTLGYSDTASLSIPLTQSTVPANLLHIDLAIEIAGRRFEFSHLPSADLTHEFTWDGLDAFQNKITYTVQARVKINYVYQADLLATSRFGEYGSGPALIPSRGEIPSTLEYSVPIRKLDLRSLGLGGWSLDAHHHYDAVGRVLHLGTGPRVSEESVSPVVMPVAGNGSAGSGPIIEGGEAAQLSFSDPREITVDGDGTIYFSNFTGCTIYKVTPDGKAYTVAGIEGSCGFSGDGGAATQAQLDQPLGIAIDIVGNLYIADVLNNRVRKVDTNGTITTVAGTGIGGFSGDGGPAIQAQIEPNRLTVDSQGNIFIADYINHRVRKVDAAGIITTVAGNGTSGYSGDGGPATQASLGGPINVEVDPDGNLYIPQFDDHRIRKVSRDGIISTFETFYSPTVPEMDRAGNFNILSGAGFIRKIPSKWIS